ncbi:MAG TPA: NAD(P)H-dependent glycerol-3-phosphate dehydrogenase [Fimbriimonadales bacterium]|nr:NAD(P)H-dependent glycerol-3-phosphate dehydrogenase [Fimbriimonadales bacterium]
MIRASILGSGSWGTALAIHLARSGTQVSLWGRDPAEIESLRENRENVLYLPDFDLPPEIEPVEVLPAEADFWIIAVPSEALREVCQKLPSDCVVVIATKGLEQETSLRMSQVLAAERPGARIAVLSGPNLAVELAGGIPTATVIASDNDELAERVREQFMAKSLRVYTSSDVVGVELGGALKNVMAIAAGMSDGLGFGNNTKGALLARGLHEMASLGSVLGARAKTFMGLSGVGDLFATAASVLSRNYRIGRALGAGEQLDDALHELGQVAEGVPTTHAAVALADRLCVDVPLMQAVAAVLEGESKPLDAVSGLMQRTPRSE